MGSKGSDVERDEVVVCYEDGVDGCGVDVFVSLEFVDLFYFRDADGEDAVGDFFSFQFDSRCCLEEDVVQAVFEAQEGYVVGVELADGVLGEVSFDEEFAVLFVGKVSFVLGAGDECGCCDVFLFDVDDAAVDDVFFGKVRERRVGDVVFEFCVFEVIVAFGSRVECVGKGNLRLYLFCGKAGFGGFLGFDDCVIVLGFDGAGICLCFDSNDRFRSRGWCCFCGALLPV